MSKTIRIALDVSGDFGGQDGPVPFGLKAGDHDPATIDPRVLRMLTETGLATATTKKGES